MNIQFDTNGNERQKDVCRAWKDDEISEIVYGGSKGSGKSYLGASLIFGDAFIYPGTHYFIARKELNDLRKYTIPTIYEAILNMGVIERYIKFNGQDNFFSCYNGSKVFLLEAKYLPNDRLYMRFGSMSMTRGWIEEAGEIDEAAKGNLMASVGRWKNDIYHLPPKLLQTCNPSKNYLYREFYKKHKDGNLEPWKRFIQAFPEDNKRLPDGYLENLRRTLNKNQRERLLHGNWEYDDDPATMIEYDNILNTFTNDFVSKKKGNRYISADIARFGRDRTVIGIWDELTCFRIIALEKNKIDEAATLIKRLSHEYNIPRQNIIIDEDGVGGGVVDILNCKGFVNNSSPLDNPETNEKENYNNLKSQCYFMLARLINANDVYIQTSDTEIKEMITEELEQVKQKDMDKDGKKSIVPKDKVREIIGRSPDFSDMLAMRMWFELKPAWESAFF